MDALAELLLGGFQLLALQAAPLGDGLAEMLPLLLQQVLLASQLTLVQVLSGLVSLYHW